MNVLSLFDGMSCGRIALTELNIKINHYYASEIDTHAIRQTQLNFPDTIQLGDVTKWREWPVSWSEINLILAGSPCQGFSFAGKKLAFDDPRSKLFFVFVEILNHVKKFNPDVKFLLENVDMKKDHLRVISEYVGVFPVNINSNLVSAQNRSRWYWTNIRTKKVGLFDEIYTDIPQPKDEGILLRDILEDEVDEKYFISQAVINRIERKTYSEPQFNPDKTGTLNTGNNSAKMSIDSGTTFISIDWKAPNQRCSTGRSLDKKHNYQIINLDGKEKSNQDKASCFTAGAHSGGNHSDMDLIMTKNYAQWDYQVKDINLNRIGRFPKDNKHGTLSSSRTNNKTGAVLDSQIRRLTPTECARLQTVPSWYKWNCSDTQIYRMCGNGWTIKVIRHILSFFK